MLPPAAAAVATGATVFAIGLGALLDICEPTLRPVIQSYLKVYPLSLWDFFWATVLLALPVWWLRRRLNPTLMAADEVMKTIDAIDVALGKKQITKSVQNAIWRGIVDQLAEQARLGGRLPDPKQLVATARQHAPNLTLNG
jgi:hypothetical protein